MIRLRRSGLTLCLELPEAAGHVLDVLQLRTLHVFIAALKMVKWVHLSGKGGGPAPRRSLPWKLMVSSPRMGEMSSSRVGTSYSFS